ncbi:MAG: hypothetical protein P8L83_05700 [Flavobacteriaceae bacterium]|nr:hypothetical protein [Flavobacteriaceae bacterium]
MKKLLLILLFFPLITFGQDLIWKSFVGPDGDRTFEIEFYSDGSIWTQGIEFNYIRDGKKSTVLKNIDGIKALYDDMVSVLKTKQTVLNEMYEIKKGSFTPIELRIDGEPKTYFFTKYAVKEFGKALKKHTKQ